MVIGEIGLAKPLVSPDRPVDLLGHQTRPFLGKVSVINEELAGAVRDIDDPLEPILPLQDLIDGRLRRGHGVPSARLLPSFAWLGGKP